MTVRKVGVLANLEKQGVSSVFERVCAWAKQQDAQLLTNATGVQAKPTLGNPFGVETADLKALFRDADILVCLGGDGTLLYAAQLIADAAVPVLSVNLGSLGFHTQVNPATLDACLHRISEGDMPVERRMMLAASFPDRSSGAETPVALNDVVISKSAWGHMVTLRLSIDGQVVSDISADALIVSSPTGSSAYNYAAGGPVFFPTMEALILNTLCAHRMRVTPLVVSPEAELEVVLRPRRPEDSAQVLLDGQPWNTLADGETLKISRADVYLPLIVFENDFYRKLREKLRWGGLI